MSYGKSRDKFPLKYGDELKSEKCTIRVHDWYSDGFPDWMKADMVYVDPPWSMGNANMFRGKAKREYINAFEPYLRALIDWIAATKPKTCYIEMGAQNLELAQQMLASIYPFVHVWPIVYYKKHPCYLIRGSFSSLADYDFAGLDDAEIPRIAVSIESPSVVADPCTGRGLTAMAAITCGCNFVGLEMIPDKLSVCVDRLTKLKQTFIDNE